MAGNRASLTSRASVRVAPGSCSPGIRLNDGAEMSCLPPGSPDSRTHPPLTKARDDPRGPNRTPPPFSFRRGTRRYIETRNAAVTVVPAGQRIETMMLKRCLSGALVALTLAASAGAATPASARDRLSPGAAAAIGVLGGLAVGGAIAASQAPVYAAPAPVYVAPAPVYAPPVVVEEHCVTERTSEYVPGWGWQTRRRTVCD
jgi:hypothetical protein